MTIPLAALLAASLAASPASAEPPQLRRFALIAGANDGGAERVLLRYATTDAEAVARVLGSLGGVAPEDQRLLLNPDRQGLEQAIVELGVQMAAATGHGRSEVLVYYSGHSDEEGLLLKGERLGYRELRTQLERLPADVRIVVLDSCSSGALTRAKGGKARPSFLSDASSRVKGHAFLTSSSEDELAQESDRLGASFFTHFLVSGLRGAADASRDGKVTLNEAYQFAFQETLARTERTQGGPQHPAYDIQLVGSGDLVMTDLRTTDARLAMAADVDGRVFVRREDGPLAAELPKSGGRVLELGLEPGRYELTVEKGGQLFRARFELQEHGRLEVGQRDLVPAGRELTVSRGGATLRRVVVNASFVPALSFNGSDDRGVLNHFSFNVYGRSGRLDGLALSLVGSWVHDEMSGLQFALGGNWSGGFTQGFQAAGFANSAHTLRGVQLAAGVNRVTEPGALGAQLGAVNLASDLTGGQLGLINLAGKVRGLQVGLINVSEDADATLGLVNVVRGRPPNVGAFYSESFMVNAIVRSGGRYLHSVFTLGFQPALRALPSRYLIGAGLGGRVPIRMFYVGADLTMGYVRYADQPLFGGADVAPTFLSALRVSLGWTITHSVSIFAGVSANHLYAAGDRGDIGLGGHTALPAPAGDGHRLFPGFFAGAEF